MFDAYREDVVLEDLLEGTVEEFENQRNAFWTDPAGKESDFLYLVQGLGNYYLRAAQFLVEPSPNEDLPFPDWSAIRDMASHPVFDRYVTEHVQLSVAKSFALRTDLKALRCRLLAERLVEHAPGEKVLQALQRVARAFIVGFYPESMILCRTVVEAAVRDTFARHKMPLPEDSDTTMRERLNTLVHRLKVLAPDQEPVAKRVWRKGSQVAHGERAWTMISQEEALSLIDDTVSVLRDLYDRRR